MPRGRITSGARHAVVLLSGGLDSATVLAIAQSHGRVCHTLSIDYGQRHRHELHAAAAFARASGVQDHRVVSINLRAIGGSALTDSISVPKRGKTGESKIDEIPVTYVPARNMLFLSVAAGFAEVVEATEVYLGVNAIDYSGYPDCRPTFINSMQRTIALGTKAGIEGKPVRIVTPLIRMSKAKIIQTGATLGVDYALTHSCYDPIVKRDKTLACGTCDSCVLRRQGFVAAGVDDPTTYASAVATTREAAGISTPARRRRRA